MRRSLSARCALTCPTMSKSPPPPGFGSSTALRRCNSSRGPRDYITFTQGRAGLALVDYDMKAMPAHIRQRIDALGGFQAALQSVLPELAMAGCVIRASTSAGLYRGDTGERFATSGGVHLYLPVIDAADMGRFL